MSEPIQRCRVKGHDWWLEAADDGPLVRHDDHVEALRQAEQRAARELLHAELRWQADEAEIQRTTFQDGVEKGQRDMLNRCIAAVRSADVAGFRGYECQEVIEADLRALGGSDE